MAKKKRGSAQVWQPEPEEKDFEGALGYLSLIARPETAERLVAGLRNAASFEAEVKDLLRASRLPLLAADDPLVTAELKKMKRGQPLSPVLLVRGDMLATSRPMEIADGYHRLCASYHTDENTPVRCRIVDA